MMPPPDNRAAVAPHGGYDRPEPMETSQVEVINPKGMYLDNPVEGPPFDRMRPRPWQDRQRGLGFSMRPFNINEVAPGDAASGLSQYRRGQFFTQLTVLDDVGVVVSAADLVWNRAIGMATARSSDTRPRFFHVSFFGNGVIRQIEPGSVGPLTQAEIQSGSGTSPSLSMLRGRVLVQDESGGRFFDVDVLGTRSFSIYAFAVTVFILLPETPDGVQLGAEVDANNPDQNLQRGRGVLEDSLCAARVVPIFQNATQIPDNITRTVEIPAGTTGFLEIPPGTTRVQIRSSFDRTPLPADYVIGFSVAPTLLAGNALGAIFVIPGTVETDSIEVPNAKFIVFTDSAIAPLDRTWIATFTVEA
jgi:hypothetical protein